MTAKTYQYYVLLTKEFGSTDWTPQFSDDEQSVVQDEYDDYLSSGYNRKQLKVITIEDNSQETINQAVAELNRS